MSKRRTRYIVEYRCGGVLYRSYSYGSKPAAIARAQALAANGCSTVVYTYRGLHVFSSDPTGAP